MTPRVIRRIVAATFVASALVGARAVPLAGQSPDAATLRASECPSCAEWNTPHEPVRIFGNVYYVGTNGLSALLITSPEGHVLLDGALPESAPLIMANIRKLGFNVEDIKLIVNSHVHFDHAGGIAQLQRASGARVAASRASASALRNGASGPDDPQFGVILPYEAVANVTTFTDGTPLRVGPITITPHITAGHTPGGTTWSWRSCEPHRCLDMVYADSQSPISADDFYFTRSKTYPSGVRDFQKGQALLETLPCDLLITPHPGATSLWERIASRDRGNSAPLLDPTGCKRFAATARQALNARITKERGQLPVAPTVTRDSLRLYYVGRAVGWERYEITSDAMGGTLQSDFDYVDRGRRNHTQATLAFGAQYAPLSLEVARLTDSARTVTTRIDVAGAHVSVMRNGATTQVDLPPVAFTLSPATPIAQHLALVRYWRAHGSPPTVAIVPGAPSNDVAVTKQGVDVVTVGGERVTLTRYAIDGLVWGVEYLWLDAADRIAMFSTAGGGLLLKGVSAALIPAYDSLMAIGARAAIRDLALKSSGATPIAQGRVALVGATLIDGTGRKATPNATVVIENGRILSAGPSAVTPVPTGVRRIDVTGKTIVPGLWDMHAHLHQLEWAPSYLATGVTSVRDMGNEFRFAIAFRDAIRSRQVRGPNLFLAGLIDGPGANAFGEFSAATPAEGRAIVKRYADNGFEQMKLYSLLAPDVVAAICDEAHQRGMTVTGHIPVSMTLSAAIEAGMDQVAHLPIRADLASDSGKRMIAQFVKRRTVFDPTASWNEIGGHSTAEPLEHFQPGAPHMPSVFLQFRASGWGSATIDSATAHTRLARSLANIRILHDAGVPIVAGTDEGVPGFSVYRELELYVMAGFTPMDAILSATSVSAKAMKVDRDVGTIQPKMRADLIVLDANPLDAISNIRSLRYVMKDGALYERESLWKVAGLREH